MPAERSAEPSKYPFKCVTLPTTLRDSILIVGPPLSGGAGALAAAALSAAAEGKAASPEAGAAAPPGSPEATGGTGAGAPEADAADAGAGGTLFSIAAN